MRLTQRAVRVMTMLGGDVMSKQEVEEEMYE
jgi:hypothetical protein